MTTVIESNSIYESFLNQVAFLLSRQEMDKLFRQECIPVRRLEWRDVFAEGGVTVRWTDQRSELPGDGENARDHHRYPAHICCVVARTMDMDPTNSAALCLRETVIRIFNRQRTMHGINLPEGAIDNPTTVDDGPRPPAEYDNPDVHIYTWTVWGYFLEPRGLQ